MLNCNRPIR